MICGIFWAYPIWPCSSCRQSAKSVSWLFGESKVEAEHPGNYVEGCPESPRNTSTLREDQKSTEAKRRYPFLEQCAEGAVDHKRKSTNQIDNPHTVPIIRGNGQFPGSTRAYRRTAPYPEPHPCPTSSGLSGNVASEYSSPLLHPCYHRNGGF